jgi:hypothetical protein
MAELRAIMRPAAQDLGQWDTKSEAAGLDHAELVRVLHEGRKRARESWEARQLAMRQSAQELGQGDATSQPQHDQRLVAGLDTALLAALCALMCQAVHRPGERDTKSEAAPLRPRGDGQASR